MAGTSEAPERRPEMAPVQVKLLGPFAISSGGLSAGPWPRPSAKQLCELVLLAPEHRVSRNLACEELFSSLEPARGARALSKALSMARAALARLGEPAASLLQADLGYIWASPAAVLEVDTEAHQRALEVALGMEPGRDRDDRLVAALADDRVLLADELYLDWAHRPRERLELLRQQARLALARDRARGAGRSRPEAVVQAWEQCLRHDPACEEAAAGLMWAYAGQGLRHLVVHTYDRCRAALEGLGLRTSPALDEVRAAATYRPAAPRCSATGPPGRARPGEERRTVSVLFAEVAAPMRLGTKLDPEDLREVVGGALATVIAEVEALGGTVTTVSGSGLAALFGAPEAHEDDPERAARAASRTVSALPASFGSEAPVVRVGIETGPAVVGPIGGGSKVEYGAVGEVVGIAAALQSLARAGSVLVGPATRAEVDDLFEWGPTEELSVGDEHKPLVASYLERPRARATGRQYHLGRHFPLVGRQAELALLSAALRQATAGSGSVVVLVGEPGLGKTRLVQECRKRFLAWVGAESGRLPLWLEGHSASYASTTPYGLYQQLLASWVGVAPDQGEAAVHGALGRALDAVMGDQELLPPLARMMGMTWGGGLVPLDPEDLQRATFAAVRALVGRLVAVGPTVLALEDLHWADPTSLRLTEELAALARDGPLLVLATSRPDPDLGLASLQRSFDSGLAVNWVELAPLTEEAERDLARSLVGEHASDEVLEAIRSRAAGNPLFLEERLSSLLDGGALVKDETGWRLCPSEENALPPVLERLVRSRVDRLGPIAQEVIVAASVLEAEFGLSALGTVTELEEKLPQALAELCSSGLITELRHGPEPSYRFRHALIQEATYKGLLKAQRRQLHAKAAWALEEAYADRPADVASLLGHHFAAAGEHGRAVHYLEVAGDRAASVFANDEAISSYRRALTIVAEQRSDGDVEAYGVQLRAKLAEVLWKTGQHGAAREVLHEAIGLAGDDGSLQAARLYNRLGRAEIGARRFEAALAAFGAAEDALGQVLEHQGQASVELWLEIQLEGKAQAHYFRNEPAQIDAVLAKVRPVVEARGGPAQKQYFYNALIQQQLAERCHRIDDEVLATARAALAAAEDGCGDYEFGWRLYMLGSCLLFYGDLAEAEERLTQALGIAERIGETSLQVSCDSHLLLTALRRHDTAMAATLAARVMEAPKTAMSLEEMAPAKASLAWLAWREGRLKEVEPLAQEALTLWATSADTWRAYWTFLWPLIALRLADGKLADAIDASRQLLVAPQQRLPDELESAVESAIADWDHGEPILAAEKLSETLKVAEDLRFI